METDAEDTETPVREATLLEGIIAEQVSTITAIEAVSKAKKEMAEASNALGIAYGAQMASIAIQSQAMMASAVEKVARAQGAISKKMEELDKKIEILSIKANEQKASLEVLLALEKDTRERKEKSKRPSALPEGRRI